MCTFTLEVPLYSLILLLAGVIIVVQLIPMRWTRQSSTR